MKKEVPSPYTMLLTEEERIIMKTRNLREDMVDNYIKTNGGLPNKTGEIRVINEVLNSLDDQVLGLVDKRLKQDEVTNTGDVAASMAAILKQLNTKTGSSGEIVELPDSYIPDDIVEGEDLIGHDPIELTDILKDNK